MENNYDRPNLENYVAKYMDENGCSLEEACANLQVDSQKLFQSINSNID